MNKKTKKICKCIRFLGATKYYLNGCEIHKNNKDIIKKPIFGIDKNR